MYLLKPGKLKHRSSPGEVHMSKIQVYRSLIAAALIGAIWYFAVLSQAAERHPMVVVGIPANSVALRHPTPEYPRTALNLHISGDALLRVQVENGVVTETTVVSHSSPLLADSASRWVPNQWNFKPSVSGVFTIPISYRESA
jgi:4-amino-4-deoxy-L-arabinose transferase-like glycosyltransferase